MRSLQRVPIVALLLFSMVILFSSCEELLNAATGDEEVAPDPPSSFLVVLGSENAIEMSWVDGSDNESGFIIESNLSTSIVWNQIADLGRNTTSFAWNGAEENNTYRFRIYAYNDVDNSSSIESGTVSVPLAGPTDLSATFTGSAVELSWTDNSQVEEGFRVMRNADGSWTELDQTGANVTSYTDVSPVSGSSSRYRVVAFGDGSTSTPSNEASVTVPEMLSAPSNLTVGESNSEITLNWQDNSSTETGFRIERSVDAGSFSQIGDVGANVTQFIDASYPADSDLAYRVFAYNNTETSGASNTATIHSAATGGATIVFEEDFESTAIDAFPGSPWTFSTSNSDTVYAFVADPGDGDQILVFADDGYPSYGWIDLDLPTIPEGVYAADYYMDNSYGNDGFGVMLGFGDQINSNADIAAWVEFIADANSGTMYLFNGTDWDDYTFPVQQWFRLVITWNMSAGYRVFLNGSQVGGVLPFYGASTGSGISGQSVVLYNNLVLYWGYMDNVVVTDGIPQSSAEAPIQRGPVVSGYSPIAKRQHKFIDADFAAPSRSIGARNMLAD